MMTEEEFLKRVEAKVDQMLDILLRDRPRPMSESTELERLDARTELTGRNILALQTEIVRIKRRLVRIEKALDIPHEPREPEL